VGSFSHFLVYLNTIIFLFYTELKCLLAPLLKTYPCEVEEVEEVEGVVVLPPLLVLPSLSYLAEAVVPVSLFWKRAIPS
jgi:hypothetical protein